MNFEELQRHVKNAMETQIKIPDAQIRLWLMGVAASFWAPYLFSEN